MRKQTLSTQFFSSSARMCQGFHWAVKQAMAYVSDNAPVGPCYESSLPGRDAFCMRDVSHQAIGAHFMGLNAHNRNMMRTFARHIREERDFCSYWEITTEGIPAPVDYTDDSDFWYNLPANFDVTCACSRLYDLTGDQGYLVDPIMADFHRISVESYARRWDRDKDGLVDRVDTDGRRGIASYDEGHVTGYSVAADALSTQCAALAAAARMLRLKGENDRAVRYQVESDRIAALFAEKWWNTEEKRFNALQMKNGSYSPIHSGINALMPVRCGIIKDPVQLEGHLDYLIAIEPEQNVEDRSYLPALLWQHGRNEAAMNIWLKMTAPDYNRREYPEVSYAAVDAIVCGYMGLDADASANLLRTRSAVADGEWAQIVDAPLWGGSIDLTHEGKQASILTNRTGRTLIWEAQLEGRTVTLQAAPGETARAEL